MTISTTGQGKGGLFARLAIRNSNHVPANRRVTLRMVRQARQDSASWEMGVITERERASQHIMRVRDIMRNVGGFMSTHETAELLDSLLHDVMNGVPSNFDDDLAGE